MAEKYTPEKIAELVAEVQRQNDNPHQYGPGAVEDLRDRLADALTAVSAERDAAHDLLGRVAGVAASSIPDLSLRDKPMAAVVDLSVTLSMAEADRDRLHKAITEALESLDENEDPDVVTIGILRAALDKEGRDS